jgi:hypothetical protein
MTGLFLGLDHLGLIMPSNTNVVEALSGFILLEDDASFLLTEGGDKFLFEGS